MSLKPAGDYANAIACLSIALGHDASKFDPDAPLPDDIPESNASKSGRQRAIDLARRENPTVRRFAQRLGGYSGLAMVGTAKTTADEIEESLYTKGSGGFTVMFPYLPGGLDDFVEGVIPELQRRSLFRRHYDGTTLREHLGLPRPHNRPFPDRIHRGAQRSSFSFPGRDSDDLPSKRFKDVAKLAIDCMQTAIDCVILPVATETR